MKSSLVFVFFYALNLCSQSVLAQVDPSSALLLKSGSSTPDSQINLDSGRYTIRQNVPSQNSQQPPSAPSSATNVQKPASKPVLGIPAPSPTPTAAEGTVPTVNPNEAFPERMKDFFLGGDIEDILKYRGALHAQDTRQNFVEVSVAPGLMYVDSKSNSWYRKFSSSGPGIGASGRFWITPFFGLNGSYFTTLAADMTASPDNTRKVNTDHRLFSAGIQSRKFFNMTRKSPSVLFGIDYDEYQLLVPKTEASRPRLKTSGVSLKLESTVPSSNTKAWVYGIDFLPKVSVKEMRTGISLRSGTRPTSYSMKLIIGQNLNFNRNQRFFWRLTHRLDKTVYEGTSSENDPITGTAPEGVSVTQGTSLLQLGFTWAD